MPWPIFTGFHHLLLVLQGSREKVYYIDWMFWFGNIQKDATRCFQKIRASSDIHWIQKLELNKLRYQHEEISNLYVHFETDYVGSAFLLPIPNDILGNDRSFADYFRVCFYATAGYPVTRILSRKYEARRQTGDILAKFGGASKPWIHQLLITRSRFNPGLVRRAICRWCIYTSYMYVYVTRYEKKIS